MNEKLFCDFLYVSGGQGKVFLNEKLSLSGILVIFQSITFSGFFPGLGF